MIPPLPRASDPLACPFCGGPAIRNSQGWVECRTTDCTALGPASRLGINCVERWNRVAWMPIVLEQIAILAAEPNPDVRVIGEMARDALKAKT